MNRCSCSTTDPNCFHRASCQQIVTHCLAPYLWSETLAGYLFDVTPSTCHSPSFLIAVDGSLDILQRRQIQIRKAKKCHRKGKKDNSTREHVPWHDPIGTASIGRCIGLGSIARSIATIRQLSADSPKGPSRRNLARCPSIRLRGDVGYEELNIGSAAGEGHERHCCLARRSADLAEVRFHAVADAAERGGGAELMNVPRARCCPRSRDRPSTKWCRTANGEVADMRLQTGENAPSARLLTPAQRELTSGGAIPLRGEQPFLRARASGNPKQ